MRRADRARAGAAGALLAPRLGAAAADLAARLGRRGALAAGVELGADGLVHERAVEARAERGVVEVDLLLAARGREPQPSVRTSTTPLRGPGTEPRTSSRLLARVDAHDLEALLGDALVAHLARAADALEDARGVGGGADRARRAHVVRAVGHGAAGEAVALDGALEALALGDARDLDALAGLEGLDGDRLADLQLAGLVAELDEVLHRRRRRPCAGGRARAWSGASPSWPPKASWTAS